MNGAADGTGVGPANWKFSTSKQVGEFLDAEFENVNYAAQSLSFDRDPAVYRDHDSSVIGRSHVDCMTAGLPTKLEPQSSCDTDDILADK